MRGRGVLFEKIVSYRQPPGETIKVVLKTRKEENGKFGQLVTGGGGRGQRGSHWNKIRQEEREGPRRRRLFEDHDH